MRSLMWCHPSEMSQCFPAFLPSFFELWRSLNSTWLVTNIIFITEPYLIIANKLEVNWSQMLRRKTLLRGRGTLLSPPKSPVLGQVGLGQEGGKGGNVLGEGGQQADKGVKTLCAWEHLEGKSFPLRLLSFIPWFESDSSRKSERSLSGELQLTALLPSKLWRLVWVTYLCSLRLL